MAEKYYVIGANDEGVTFVQEISENTISSELRDDGWLPPDLALPDLPTPNPAHWHGRYVIIKGEIVLPKPVEVVTAWKV